MGQPHLVTRGRDGRCGGVLGAQQLEKWQDLCPPAYPTGFSNTTRCLRSYDSPPHKGTLISHTHTQNKSASLMLSLLCVIFTKCRLLQLLHTLPKKLIKKSQFGTKAMFRNSHPVIAHRTPAKCLQDSRARSPKCKPRHSQHFYSFSICCCCFFLSLPLVFLFWSYSKLQKRNRSLDSSQAQDRQNPFCS